MVNSGLINLENTYSLSPSQERLYFLDRLDPGNPAYNFQVLFEISGEVDLEVLRKSIDEVITKNESLRVNFVNVKGVIRKKLNDYHPVKLNITSIDDEKLLNQILVEEGSHRFNLMSEPLYRYLVVLGENKSYIAWNFHHIIMDVHSSNILLREFAEIYQSNFLNLDTSRYNIKKNLHLPELRAVDDRVEYWREKFSDQPAMLSLTLTNSEQPSEHNGYRVRRKMSETLSAKLRQVCANQNTDVSTVLFSTFNVLLYKYTSTTDITVGFAFNEGSKSENQLQLGCYVNPLPVRTRLSSLMTIKELLQINQNEILETKQNSMPFQNLIEFLQIKNEKNQPLFQVMYEYHNIKSVNLENPNNTIQIAAIDCEINNNTYRMGLTLEVIERDGDIFLTFEYDPNFIGHDLIASIHDHYNRVLETLSMETEHKISEISILSDKESEIILNQWNLEEINYPEDLCFHKVFENIVETHSSKVALLTEDKEVTYNELNMMSNQLAHYLIERNISIEETVVVSIDHSIDLAVSIFAVLKAGACCVPIDHDYPLERKKIMIEISKPVAVITHSKFKNEFSILGNRVIYIDEILDELRYKNTKNPETLVKDSNLALIFFTSGSTGKPKGAATDHRGRCSRMLWETTQFKINENDRHLLKVSISAGVFVKEFFWPLLTGGQLVIANPLHRQDSNYIVSLIKNRNITAVTSVSTMLKMLLHEREITECTSIKNVFCSGDPMENELKEQFFNKLSKATLHNTYGMSEISTATYNTMTIDNYKKPVTIGLPAGVRVYILDNDLMPVPIGVVGEFYISGLGLAREYYGQPELTQERFIPDPYCNDQVMYKTADRGYYLPDGVMQYVGRTDDQIKINGFRVELGEIREVLNQYLPIKESVVKCKVDKMGQKYIVAYVVSNKDGIQVSEITDYLKNSLPSYMIPTIVLLEKLPRNGIGKIDHSSLPEPQIMRDQLNNEYVKPTSDSEIKMASIWRNVLDIEEIGVNDTFLDLGGDSLRSVFVASLIEDKYGLFVSIQDILHYPLNELAEKYEL